MTWKKDGSGAIAAGKNGTFTIKKSCGKFWPRYVSSSGGKSFNGRPADKISEAKAQCENNHYWEA